MQRMLGGLFRKGRFHLQLQKIAIISIVVNVLEIVAILFAILALHLGGYLVDSREYILPVLSVLLAVVGAFFSIRDAQTTIQLMEQTEQLKITLAHVEQLNTAIRAQRHDFMNHLQVVHSLIELGESPEALEYIERVYGNIQKSARALRTASPAINALLSAKVADAESHGITVEMEISSNWKNLPMPAWEMCRVLGNIIDNALAALGETEAPVLRVALYEDLHSFDAKISNNGPMIPLSMHEKIFYEGVTTKGEGHGMGLYNVQQILEAYDGAVTLTSDAEETSFTITVPRMSEIKEATDGDI